MKNAITAIVTILLIASVAGNAYFFLDSSSKTKKLSTTETELSDTKTKLMAVEKEHAKHTAMDNHMHEGETMAKDSNNPLIVDTPDGSDEDMTALRKAANSAVGGSEDTSTAILKISKKIDNAASISVTPLKYGAATTGGFQLVMVKKDGVWTKLFSAQQYDPSQDALLEEAGIPVDFLKSE